ncbi:ABC transporter transmembrane domain-containing protein [Brevundimonas sp. 2R-24]|uniref:ABC transporter transmembrane domain-containing protein n=1 Tax=Peiella sedimenti TaxID=3061083 RepID=A0ABT8SIJ7_9CAUL|nr:ABC transporter transmembrane domain-containing protein [Caulobacteraceae bacterium XZ-24]
MSEPGDLTRDRPGQGAVLAAQLEEQADRRGKRRDIRPLARLAPYALRRWSDAALAGLFLIVSSAASLALTVTARLTIDHGFMARDESGIGVWFLILGANAVVLGLATALRYFFVTKTGERIIADLREAVFASILRLDRAHLSSLRTGEVLSRLTTDVQIVDNLLTTSVSFALRNLLTLIGAVILLFIVSPKLTALVLAGFPFVLGPLFLYARRVRRLTVESQDRFAEAVGLAGESLDALETVQAFGREGKASSRFSDAVEGAFGVSLRRMRARAFMTALMICVVFGGVTAVLWLGARDVVSGNMSEGALLQFVLLAVFAAGAVGALGETWGDVQKAAGAMERIDELLAIQPQITAPAAPQPLPQPAVGEVTLEDVEFSYPGRPDLPALRGFSLHVRPGETVALVGPSGSGKSTVFRLLLRFYDPDRGVVRLDGVDLRQADPAEVRGRMAWVAQDAPLFTGSALDNIRFGREPLSEDEARRAAEAAQAWSFLERLPGGLNAPLGERGRSLSGGQRQRLAIARALVREAPLLLLDEATSALDAENERLVQLALERAMEGRTTLVIAHRLATVLKADRIVVMDEGRVVEEGDHAGLVAQGGLYARLAALQFQGA